MDDVGPAPRIEGYDVQRCIGDGGLAQVWLSVEERTTTPVAVKVLRDRGPKASARVDRELRINRTIGNVAGVATTYHHIRTQDGHDCLVMPYFPDGTLAEFVGVPPRLSPDDVTSVGAWLAYVLDRAHRRGVLHLDIKPSNILIDGDGYLYLADFGISWLRRPGEDTVEATLGYSPGFAPPEQMIGEQPDRRADIYALGATLTALLTGAPPRHDARGNRRPIDYPAGAQRLGSILDRATAFDAHDRFAEAADLWAALCPGGQTPSEARVPTAAQRTGERTDQRRSSDAEPDQPTPPKGSTRARASDETIADAHASGRQGRNGSAPREDLDVDTSISILASAAAPRSVHSVIVTATRRCPRCQGVDTGHIRCGACHGNGRITGPKRVSFRLPEGFVSGSTIRLRGHGSHSANSAHTGDAIVRVVVVPDPPADEPTPRDQARRQKKAPPRDQAPPRAASPRETPPRQQPPAEPAADTGAKWWQYSGVYNQKRATARVQRLLDDATSHYRQDGQTVRAVMRGVFEVPNLPGGWWTLCAVAVGAWVAAVLRDWTASASPVLWWVAVGLTVALFVVRLVFKRNLIVLDSRIVLARYRLGRSRRIREVASATFGEVRPSLVAAVSGTKGHPKLEVGGRSVRVPRDHAREYLAPATGTPVPPT